MKNKAAVVVVCHSPVVVVFFGSAMVAVVCYIPEVVACYSSVVVACYIPEVVAAVCYILVVVERYSLVVVVCYEPVAPHNYYIESLHQIEVL